MPKNLMIIDAAANCSFDVYKISDEEFRFIFADVGQELQFIDALVEMRGREKIREALKGVYNELYLNKALVEGIHGTLFYERPDRRELFPMLRWHENDTPSDFDEKVPLGTDKNIMIDDGKDGCRYDMYRITQEQFMLLFPDRKMYQEFEFSEDLVERHDEAFVANLIEGIKVRRYRNKANVKGLHGTLYVDRREDVKWAFPNKNYYRNNPDRYRWGEEDDKEWGYADDAKSK